MVANDLCIKAKNRCGSNSRVSSGLVCSGLHGISTHRIAGSLSLSSFIIIDDTTVKLLSLKRQKIGMIHINCFQPKHMATYVVGARKPSQETFLLSTQNIRGL